MIALASRGGRRQQSWGAPLSWREAQALEVARAVTAARQGALSRADWLLGLAEGVLQAGIADTDLPPYVRARAEKALALLETERAEDAAYSRLLP